jgi:hypothetical protein
MFVAWDAHAMLNDGEIAITRAEGGTAATLRPSSSNVALGSGTGSVHAHIHAIYGGKRRRGAAITNHNDAKGQQCSRTVW